MSKTLFLINIFISVLLFSSCNKDYSYEGGIANGDIQKDSIGNCSINVYGSFYQNKNLNASNYLEIKIKFLSIGVYNLKSDTVDGFHFSGVHVITSIGLTTIKLIGQGKPLSLGNKKFKLKSNLSECDFFVNIVTEPPPINKITINCATIKVLGNYVATTILDTTNKIILDVVATQSGPYNFTSNIINGVSFAASGFFPAAGNFKITMLPTSSSVPLNASLPGSQSVYDIIGATNNCNFSVIYEAAPAAYTVACNNIVVSGNYIATFQLNNSNKITLSINVTSIGSYNIRTNTLNGVAFGATGNFSTIGNYLIDLFPLPNNNIPTNSMLANYTLSSASNNCSFGVNFAPPPLFATYFVSCNNIAVSGVYTAASAKSKSIWGLSRFALPTR